jgi:hypothetical protein
MRMLGLKPSIPRERRNNSKLPSALAKLTQQSGFEMVKRLLGVVASLDSVMNLLRQIGKFVCIFELLGPDAHCGELRLNEVEPD